MPQLAPTPNSFRGPSPLKSRRPPPPPLRSDSAHDEVPDLIPDDSPSPPSPNFPPPPSRNFAPPPSRNFPPYTGIHTPWEVVKEYYPEAKDMGFFKKKGDHKGKDTPEPQNPYADQPVQDEYTSQAPPRYDGRNHIERAEKSPAWTSQNQQQYANSASFGMNGGYGSDRFNQSAQPARARQGGYGGLGSADDRSALLGADRYQQREPPQLGVSGQSGGYGGYKQHDTNETSNAYGNGLRYDDLQLTEEERVEREVNDMRLQSKELNRDAANRMENSYRLMLQAQETSMNTMARLHEQGARLANTERNIDLATSQNKIATDQTKVLKTAAHMFHMPDLSSTAKTREVNRQDKVLQRHQAEQAEFERSRKEQMDSMARLQEHQQNTQRSSGATFEKSTLAERSKFALDPDDSDDEVEDRIDVATNRMLSGMAILKQGAIAMGQEADAQSKRAERIEGKVGGLHQGVLRNTDSLQHIH